MQTFMSTECRITSTKKAVFPSHQLSLDDPVISFFPDDTPTEPGWQLEAMRIRDLITMTTGHRREPWLFNVESDWVKTFLHSDIEFKPGTHFQYNSAATYMLSAILQSVTGERLVDYLDKRLFRPLMIQKPDWDLSPEGINTGGWGLRITTEDIAKLGQLYLQKGIWQGERILSEAWVKDCLLYTSPSPRDKRQSRMPSSA